MANMTKIKYQLVSTYVDLIPDTALVQPENPARPNTIYKMMNKYRPYEEL